MSLLYGGSFTVFGNGFRSGGGGFNLKKKQQKKPKRSIPW